MPATLLRDSDSVYRLHLTGLLRKRELEQVKQSAAEAIQRAGAIHLLCVMEDFEGWERTEEWGDMSFYVTFGRKIKRIAIVADERWRDEALLFAGAGLRQAAVEFFPLSNLAAAQRWVAEKAEDDV